MKKRLLSFSMALTLGAGLTLPSLAAEPAQLAYASTQMVLVDGEAVEFQAYALKDEAGNDTNYVKLRDVAFVLNGTPAQFAVGWKSETGWVSVTTGTAYTPDGSELSTPFEGDRPYTPVAGTTLVDQQAAHLDAFFLFDDQGGGYTYYKLRDLGTALGFRVDWTEETGVTIQTGKEAAGPDEETAPLTEETVLAAINALRESYPEGMSWINDNSHHSPALHLTGYGCEGFALICSDAAFEDLPVSTTHSDFDAIRVGDLLRINHDTHTVIVLEKRADSVVVAEGNYNRSIHWDRELSRKSLEDGDFTVRSRWEQ